MVSQKHKQKIWKVTLKKSFFVCICLPITSGHDGDPATYPLQYMAGNKGSAVKGDILTLSMNQVRRRLHEETTLTLHLPELSPDFIPRISFCFNTSFLSSNNKSFGILYEIYTSPGPPTTIEAIVSDFDPSSTSIVL